MFVDHIRDFFVRRSFLPARIVAAVSGGGDSSALLLALCELRNDGCDVVAAHVNHHLRGAESDGDEQFVRALCEELGVVLHVADGTLCPDALGARGVEAAAREIRMVRLQAIRAAECAALIATAHHRDDQAETILMRLMSGGGPAAMRGIRAVREDGIIRPMLDLSRAAVDDFLRQRHVTARVDSSNADPRFRRNQARLMLRGLDRAATATLLDIAENADLQWPYLLRAIDAAEAGCAEPDVRETRFRRWPDDLWIRQALLHRHILRLDPDARDISAEDLARLARSVDRARRISVTRALELIRSGDGFVLRRRPLPAAAFEVTLQAGEAVQLPALGATIEVVARVAGSDAARRTPKRQPFCLPSGAEPRFVVRNRRNGDRFQPLGMRSAKKLKNFLIDRKVPVEFRDRLPLLLWHDEIVWVGGVEVSERFKLGPADAAGDCYEVALETAATDTP